MSIFTFGLLAPVLFFKKDTNENRNINNNHSKQPFIPRDIEENDVEETNSNFVSIYFSRIQSFFKAPIVYFAYESIFLFGFLLLFSYTILCDINFVRIANDSSINDTIIYTNQTIILKPKFRLSTNEIILIIWVIFIQIEEIYQVKTLISKLFRNI